jgi:hypothetical protein
MNHHDSFFFGGGGDAKLGIRNSNQLYALSQGFLSCDNSLFGRQSLLVVFQNRRRIRDDVVPPPPRRTGSTSHPHNDGQIDALLGVFAFDTARS